jgi:hypothetical protein
VSAEPAIFTRAVTERRGCGLGAAFIDIFLTAKTFMPPKRWRFRFVTAF